MNSLASPPQIKHITLIICTLDVPGLILTYHVYPKRTEPLLLWFGSKLCKCQDCNWTLHKGPAIFIHRQESSRVFEFLFHSVNKSTFHQSTGIKSRLAGTRYLSVFQLHSLISSPAKPSLGVQEREEKRLFSASRLVLWAQLNISFC